MKPLNIAQEKRTIPSYCYVRIFEVYAGRPEGNMGWWIATCRTRREAEALIAVWKTVNMKPYDLTRDNGEQHAYITETEHSGSFETTKEQFEAAGFEVIRVIPEQVIE